MHKGKERWWKWGATITNSRKTLAFCHMDLYTNDGPINYRQVRGLLRYHQNFPATLTYNAAWTGAGAGAGAGARPMGTSKSGARPRGLWETDPREGPMADPGVAPSAGISSIPKIWVNRI